MPQAGAAGERLASIPGVVPVGHRDADGVPLPPALPVRDRRSATTTPVELTTRVGDGHRVALHPGRRARAGGRAMTANAPRHRAGRRPARCSRAPASPSTSRSGAACCAATVGHVRAVDGVDLAVAAGHDRRPGRRVGFGQVDARPRAAAPRSTRPRARSPSTATTSPGCRSRRCASAAAACRSCSRTRSRRSTRWRRSPTAWPSRCATTSISRSSSGKRRCATCCAR